MTNFCSNCGTKLIPGKSFCHECGAKVVQTNAKSSPSVPKQAQPLQTQPDNLNNGYNRSTPIQAQQQVRKQQQPYRQPVQPVPNQQPIQQNQARQQSGKKRGSAIVILTIILAVILVVEGVVAGLWYPGFFNPGKGSGSFGIGGKDPSTMSKDLSDADFNIDYTDQEIAAAPKTEMKVSAESPSASSGDYSVDFGSFNELEDDTFTLRDLPVHDFEKDGYSVKGYDLSLASGKNKFAGEVCVTYPRTGDEGDLVLFMSKDPDTGENERLYYEISDDGEHYLVYTDHFSQQVQVAEKLKTDVQYMNVNSSRTRKELSSFFYYDPEQPYLQSEVRYNPDDFWEKVKDNGDLTLASERLKSLIKDSNSASSSWLPRDYTAMMYMDADAVREATSDADAINNGITLFSEGAQAITAEGTSAAIQSGSEFFTSFGAMNTVLNFQANTTKAIEEIEDGKYEDWSAAQWGHFSDNLGTTVSLLGLSGAAVGSTPVTVIAAVAGLGMYALSKSAETPFDDLDQSELNYRAYFGYDYPLPLFGGNYDQTSRCFYYDDPQKPAQMKAQFNDDTSYGIIPRLSCLDDKQNEIFKQYLNDRYISIRGQDTREDHSDKDSIWLGREDWMQVLKGLYEATKDKPEVLSKAIPEFYWNYCNACSPYFKDGNGNKISTVTESEYLSFCRERMKARGAVESAARLPDEQEMNSYAELYYDEMLVCHRPIFQEFAEYLDHQAQIEADTMIETELLPMLNTKMIFSVDDISLEDGKTFQDSIYNVAPQKIDVQNEDGDKYKGKYEDIRQKYESPMEFCFHEDGNYIPVSAPVFLPAVGGYIADGENGYRATRLFTAPEEWYYPVTDNFWPKCLGGNDVFVCTFYHYLMMGAPNAMSFYDMVDNERYSNDFNISMRDANGVLHVNVLIDDDVPADGLMAYLGTWKGSYTTTRTKENRNICLEVKKYQSSGDLSFSLYKGAEETDVLDFHSSIKAKDLKSKSLKTEKYEYDGTTLTFYNKSTDYEAKMKIHGDTITVTQQGYYLDDNIEFVYYDYEYTLTKVSDTVD